MTHSGERRRTLWRGHAMVEYAIVTALLAVAVFAGPDSPMERLVRAVHDHYGRFTFAIGMP